MGKIIKFNNYKNQKMIKTVEELQTENQENKSELVEKVEVRGITEALQIMRYEDKYFIGFMGAMMTTPTEDKKALIEDAKMLTEKGWSLLLNIVTHMIKNRKLIDNLNNNENEQ